MKKWKKKWQIKRTTPFLLKKYIHWIIIEFCFWFFVKILNKMNLSSFTSVKVPSTSGPYPKTQRSTHKIHARIAGIRLLKYVPNSRMTPGSLTEIYYYLPVSQPLRAIKSLFAYEFPRVFRAKCLNSCEFAAERLTETRMSSQPFRFCNFLEERAYQ